MPVKNPCAVLLLAVAGAAGASEEVTFTPTPGEREAIAGYSGQQLYRRFCASCHGDGGFGDGPVAPALNVHVPDLTRISQRQGGRFPTDRVRAIVDGRAVIPAHGTRYMPVWGYELEARSPAEAPSRAVAQGLIDRLVEYLRSIQQ